MLQYIVRNMFKNPKNDKIRYSGRQAFTMVLIRSFQVVSISQQSPDGLSQTVFVGFLGSLIQQSVGDQTRVSTILHILTSNRGQKNTKDRISYNLGMQCWVEKVTQQCLHLSHYQH